ncbi:hypothetical protein HII36_55220 [Nonomuraea sp. NN258]|uniref:DUF6461 domain-containing protein n=1 Tax=Nonomuraea antri TaxID=2730852 RepID=UPI00156A1469|nr:DUF6461 domain-containing protein [Nonomuraea antri]NRQ40900.1 hypothetical protein [Nonomuraea antri]
MRSRTHLHDLLVSTIFTEGLDAEMDLWVLGFSAVWIKGPDLDAVARAFSLDLATREPCHLSEILDHAIADGSHWVGEVDGWIGVVPGHGHREFLRSLSEGGGEAVGLCMDIHGHAYFDHARDGRIVVSFDPQWPQRRSGDDPHALDRLMAGLRFQISDGDVRDDPVEDPESISSALALIGRVIGSDLAEDWFLARHSRFGTTH